MTGETLSVAVQPVVQWIWRAYSNIELMDGSRPKGAHLALRSGMNKNWRLFVFYKMIGFSFSAPVCCDFSDQLRGAGARKYVVWDTQHEQEGQRLHV